MKRTDSFMAAVFATWGVIAAIGIAAAAFYFVSREIEKERVANIVAKDRAADAEARRLAMPELKLFGITALSDDTGLVRDGADTVLVGTGLDKKGDPKRLSVRFHVAKFGQKTTWKILSVNIEGERVYEAKQ